MSVQFRNQTTGTLERAAGFTDTDAVLSATSRNPIQNKAVHAALAQKIDKTVSDLENYYNTSQVYNKQEVRDLIGSINTLTIEVVATLPTQDISSTTIYFVGPAAGTNTYDEYVYVNNTWVKIGDTEVDLSNYVTSAALTTALQSYYDKTQTDALFNDYYDKDTTDDLLDLKQDKLTFDNQPIAGSPNPVTSAGIKTALDNILISGNGGSIIKVHHTSGAAAAGNTVTASKGDYSVSSSFDVSGDAIIIGFGEIGEVTITATNGSEVGTTTINIPCFSSYSATLGYGLDYVSQLTAANINPSYYTSLDEVLADEEAIRKLMTIHASVDYLATADTPNDEMALIVLNNNICAKQINLRDYAMDTLSANTYLSDMMDNAGKYGYGEQTLNSIATDPRNTSASTEYSSNYIAGNGVDEFQTYGQLPTSTDTINNCYFQYVFPSPVLINQIGARGISTSSSSGGVKTFELYVSTNGNSWIPTGETVTFDAYDSTQILKRFENDTAYRYYRFVLKKIISGGPSSASGMKFYLYSQGPKGNIPIMTSNTAPFGAATCSSYYDSNDLFNAYRSFSHNNLVGRNQDDRGQLAAKNTSDQQVQYVFPTPVKVKRQDMTSHYGSTSYTFNFTLSGSQDGVNFTTLATQSNIKADLYTVIHSIEIAEPDQYLYYRITVSGTVDSTNQGTRHQFYGREMKISVPKMTNFSVPYGTITASSNYADNYNAVKAFDQAGTSTQYHSTAGVPQQIGYEFTQPNVLKLVRIMPTGSDNVTLKIQAFDESINDQIDLTNSELYYGNANAYITINNNKSYSKYRLYCSDTTYISGSSKYVRITTIQFYSLDYSEYDQDTTHPRHYFYDHGLELDDLDWSNYTISGQTLVPVIKEESQLYFPPTSSTSKGNVVGTNNTIDLTPYSFARVRFGNKNVLDNSAFGQLMVGNTKQANSSVSDLSVGLTPTVDAGNLSSFMVSKYINLNAGYNTRTLTITEQWLE